MLRILTSAAVAAALILGLAAVAADDTHVAPSDTSDAKQQAADALQEADRISRQKNFREELARERAAAATVQPGAIPKINLGGLPQPPSTADVIDSVRNPQAPKNWSETNQSPPLVMVSFSMPDADLRELARQAASIGGSVILRGLVDNSFPATQKRMETFKDIPGVSFMVDPTLFRRFKVTAVPTFVLPLESLKACSKEPCQAPAHISVEGESGLEHILDEIQRRAADPRAKKRAVELQAMLKAAA